MRGGGLKRWGGSGQPCAVCATGRAFDLKGELTAIQDEGAAGGRFTRAARGLPARYGLPAAALIEHARRCCRLSPPALEALNIALAGGEAPPPAPARVALDDYPGRPSLPGA